MSKNILILSSSPRRGGNSDLLCDAFLRGAQESGNRVEKIFLADKKINYCNGCDICSHTGKPCPQKDDAAEVIDKMTRADVLVLATPVYFYAMSAQLKTLIDRCCGRYAEMGDKNFYLLASAAEEGGELAQHVFDNIQGFLDCLDNPVVKGKLLCGGVWHKGEIKGNQALKEAYEMGMSV
ncbi:MAG: flavodoxin family protein [Bacteroidales bacterium]|nr:flavodoxin family protein [Bacteroidales bacterium]MDD3201270.1 flavodoxin family protein [Bacteroidales bacterium]